MHREGWPASRAKDRQWGTDVICYGLRDASWALYPTPVPSAHGGARNRNNNDWFDYANTRDRFDIYRSLVIQSTLNQGKVRNCWVTGGGLVAWRAGFGMWAWIRYWIIPFFCFIDPFIYHSPHMILFWFYSPVYSSRYLYIVVITILINMRSCHVTCEQQCIRFICPDEEIWSKVGV